MASEIKKYFSESNMMKVINTIIGICGTNSENIETLKEQCISDYSEDVLYSKDNIVIYNNNFYRAKTSYQGAWDDTKFTLLDDSFTELSTEDIKGFLNLSTEELNNLQNLIDDAQVTLNKTYSSSKIYTDIQNAIKDCKTYTQEEFAKASFVSIKVVADISEVTDTNFIYLVGTASPYTIAILVEGDPTPTELSTLDIDLSQYYDKDYIDANFYTQADADGKFATITTIDNHIGDTDIHTTATEKASYVKKTDIVDNLTSTDTNKPLSANQGKVLNENKLDKADVDKVTIINADGVNIKDFILEKCTDKNKLYYIISRPNCTDVPKVNTSYFMTIENAGYYTIKVTAKELIGNNNEYVCTYRIDSTKWSNWEKVLLSSNISTTIDNTSTDDEIPSAKVIFDRCIQGKRIDQSVINTYGTEILKYPLGRWIISSDSIAGKFTDLPIGISGHIDITSISYNDDNNPWSNQYAYRVYSYVPYSGSNYVRKLESGSTAGVITNDTGWQKVCTTKVADVGKTNITLSDTTNYYLNSGFYSVRNGICEVQITVTCTTPQTEPNDLATLPTPSNGTIHEFFVAPGGSVIQATISSNGGFCFRHGATGDSYFVRIVYLVAES